MVTARLLLVLALLAGPAFGQTSPLGSGLAEPPAQPVAPLSDPLDRAGLPQAEPGAGAAAAPAPDTAAVAPVGPAPAGGHGDLVTIVSQAHWLVQAVMALLAFAALVALTVWLHKTVEFALARRRLAQALRLVGNATTLDEAARAMDGTRGPGAEMARAAAQEMALALDDPALLTGTRDRTRLLLERIEAGAALRLRAGTGVLGSIAATAPFIGLFGTVFGIMNSFIAIADSGTTSLAVVAPGIAEALLATAIGLAAAIPAVLIHNLLSRRLAGYRHRMNDLAAALEALQSRALDRAAAQGRGA
jgi:biopolymer transport protein ExbB